MQVSGSPAAGHVRENWQLTKASGRPKQMIPNPIPSNVEPNRAPDVQFFATCHPGLEDVVAQELLHPSIAASPVVVGKAGVTFW